MNVWIVLQKISLVPSYLWDKMWVAVWKRCMKHCGKNVYLRPMSSDIRGLRNLSVGDGTSIPKGSTIYCTNAPCTIGNKVVFGRNLTIMTSDHHIVQVENVLNINMEVLYLEGVNHVICL